MNIRWLLAITLLFGHICDSSATLIIDDPSLGIVRDDRGTEVMSDDKYWIQDFGRFTNLSYGDQLSSIEAMNGTSSSLTAPWGDWRMANMDDVLGLFENPFGGAFYNFFQPSYAQISSYSEYTYYNVYYFARIDDWSEVQDFSDRHSVSARNIEYLEWNDGTQQPLDSWNYGLDSVFYNPGDDVPKIDLGAWVVADRISYSVPEPASVFLVCSGIIGVIGIRLRRKSNLQIAEN